MQWTPPGNKAQTNSRSAATFPRQLLGNKHHAARHLPRQEKARSCPAPLMHSKAGRRAGMDGCACPGKTPALVAQPGESPSFLQRSRPGLGRAEGPPPLCSSRPSWWKSSCSVGERRQFIVPSTPTHRQPARARAGGLPGSIQNVQPRSGVSGEPQSPIPAGAPLLPWASVESSRHRSRPMLRGQGRSVAHRTVGPDTPGRVNGLEGRTRGQGRA
ncbi:hypothetical protein NN561_006884 [Cricetulus griseus]